MVTVEGYLPDEVLIKPVACLVWLCWAGLLVSVAAEITARVSGRPLPRPVAEHPLQRLVAVLVGAIVVCLLAGPARACPLSYAGRGLAGDLAGDAAAHRPRAGPVARVGRPSRPPLPI